MFLCPNDERPLLRQEQRGGVYWGCPSCGGRTATLAMLRQAAGGEFASRLWGQSRSGAGEGKRRCPACEQTMRVVSAPVGGSEIQLDVCRRCYFVWFDPQEFESLRAAPPLNAAKEQALPLQARLMMAKMDVEALDTRPDLRLAGSEPPEEGWKAIPALFGMPVEQESRSLAHLPWATWAVAGGVALFSVLAFFDLERAVSDFGLIPAEAGRYWGLTLLTAFFLHGGAGHVAGNLYFLAAFGDDVEDYLGSGRYLLVLLLATLAGAALHILVRPDSTVPVIGASSGISGLLTCYALQFPRARIGFLLRLPWIVFRWIEVRARVYVLGWIVLQAVGVWRQGEEMTQVSVPALLGGAAVGFLYWFFWPEVKGSEE